jgi:hypothetical protein
MSEPGTDVIGWLAQSGNVPLGYLGDPDKTARTFPVIDGVRYAVPGDRARLLDDGSVQVLGRDSVTINSGGEKIFAEEVEAAVLDGMGSSETGPQATHVTTKDSISTGTFAAGPGSAVVSEDLDHLLWMSRTSAGSTSSTSASVGAKSA